MPVSDSTVRPNAVEIPGLVKLYTTTLESRGSLFPTASGGPLTRSAITDRLKRATKAAVGKCASLVQRRVSPHTFRHYAGFRTIPGEVDLSRLAAA
jgi:integrase